MGSIGFLLVAVATAVQFGWQPTDSGGREYIIQVEPQLIDTFRKEGFASDVPPQLRDIRKIRVVVGNGTLPHQGEMVPRDGDKIPVAAKLTNTAKAGDSSAARLAGIGDIEDPIPEAFIPKLTTAKSAPAKADADKTVAAAKATPSKGTPKTMIAAKVLAPDDPLPGPAVDRPAPQVAGAEPGEPPLVPIAQPAPMMVKNDNSVPPEHPIAKAESPAQPAFVQPSPLRPSKIDSAIAEQPPVQPRDNPPVTKSDIHAPPLLSPDAKTAATPVTGAVRSTFASDNVPAANTKSWATDKPALSDSEPPADPTPDTRSGSRWGNGGRSTDEGSAQSGGNSSNDPFAQKTHLSPSEQPIGVGLANETPRPWFALLTAGAMLAVSIAANVYLAWIYWTTRVRYLDLVEELHGQPHAIDDHHAVEEPVAAHT